MSTEPIRELMRRIEAANQMILSLVNKEGYQVQIEVRERGGMVVQIWEPFGDASATTVKSRLAPMLLENLKAYRANLEKELGEL